MQNKLNTVIALNGELPISSILQEVCKNKFIIASDFAGYKLIRRGVRPNIVIGDLDSSKSILDLYEEYEVKVIKESSQEINDFEKALNLSIQLGNTEITVVGFSGGQTDHILNNFSILAKYSHRLKIKLIDSYSIGCILSKNNKLLNLEATIRDRISLIPMYKATLNTSGLNWEIKHEELKFGCREGASNFAKQENIVIELLTGCLAVFHFYNAE